MGTAFGILLLLVLCGFIAYVGDLLGRRLGKKRLSIFGLRPKHTAILLTIVTGVLIATLTFGAALATIPGFAEVVTRGERLYHENQSLDRQNRKARHEADLLTVSSQRLGTQNDGLRATNQTLAGTNDRLATTNRGLDGDNGRLRKENGALGQTNRDLHAHNQELREGNGRLAGDNGSLRKEQGVLSAKVEGLNSEISRLNQLASSYRDDRYLFRRGEEIERVPIPKDPPREVLQQIITDRVPYQVRTAVEGKSERPADQPLEVTLTDPPGFPGGKDRDAAAHQRRIREWVVSRMMEIRGNPLALRIVASENCVDGQPVRVLLDWYANEVVISRGELLGSRQLDGKDTRGVILLNLLALLRGDVNRKARKAGMVPRGNDDVGETGYDLLLDTVDKVRQIGGPAVVVARARYDTPRSGPLSLDLEVKPPPAVTAERS